MFLKEEVSYVKRTLNPLFYVMTIRPVKKASNILSNVPLRKALLHFKTVTTNSCSRKTVNMSNRTISRKMFFKNQIQSLAILDFPNTTQTYIQTSPHTVQKHF